MPDKDTPPEGYQFAPLPPVPDPRFVAPQGYAFADQGRPEPVPLRETNVAPVQIDPRSVQTDRDTALELTQLGLDIAGMMLLPGPKGLKVPGKGAKEFGLYLGKRGLWAAGVGGTTAGAKEVASRLMGYPPDPHLGTTIAVHSGLMAGFELGGGLVQNAPTAYRAFRVSTGGPAYMQRLTDKAAAKATQEDLYRFMQEMGLVPPVQGGAPAATSIGRISGRKGTKAIERFGEQTIGGAQFSNVDETLLGELRNSQVKILNDFGTMVSREEAGLNLQKVIAATDRGVDMAYSSGVRQLVKMTGDAPIIDPVPEARKAIAELERIPRGLEKKGYPKSFQKSARRTEIEKEYEEVDLAAMLPQAHGRAYSVIDPLTGRRMALVPEEGRLLTIEQAAFARSHFLKLGRMLPETDRDVLPLARKLAAAYETSIRSGLAGNPDALALWKSTNKVYREWAEKYESNTIAKLVNANPYEAMAGITPEDTVGMQRVYDATHLFGSGAQQQERWIAARRLWWQTQLKGAKEAVEETTGDLAGKALSRRIVAFDDLIREGGDASQMMKKFFTDPKGRELVQNTHTIRKAIDTMQREAGGAHSFHYWWMARMFIAEGIGLATGLIFGDPLVGGAAGMAGFAGLELGGAGLTAIMHSKRATDIFVRGMQASMPKAGRALNYLMPSVQADILRAVKTGLQEMGIFDTEEFLASFGGQEKPAGMVAPGVKPLPAPKP